MGKSGKKHSFKPLSPTLQPAPAPARNGTNTSSAAASPAAVTTWIDDLSEEDRKIAIGCNSLEELERKKEKMEAAAKKATANQKEEMRQNERKKQWEKEQQKDGRKQEKTTKKEEKQLEKYVQQALKEGVVQCVFGDDGVWWAQLGAKDWKEAQDEYYCTLCDKHLNGWTLQAHGESKAHRSKADWAFPGAAAAARPVARPPPKAPPPTSSGGYEWRPQVDGLRTWEMETEEWMELLADGNWKCIPCGKVIDEQHLRKDDHINRVHHWKENQALRESGYKAPPEEHLAFVPCDENDPSSERWLKCLLCSKGYQDDWSHKGCVGEPNPLGSKEHLKNLRNYEWYWDQVKQDRLRWHPETAKAASAPTKSAATAAPAKATPAPWAKAASVDTPQAPPTSAPPPAPLALPPGWEEAKDEEGNVFFWHPETEKTQWSRPQGTDATASSAAAAAIQLPPGWEVGDQDGIPYYYNMKTYEAVWETSEIPEDWEPPDVEDALSDFDGGL